jgi:hypothetical protein
LVAEFPLAIREEYSLMFSRPVPVCQQAWFCESRQVSAVRVIDELSTRHSQLAGLGRRPWTTIPRRSPSLHRA